jgi:hypothetical protein
MKPIRIAVVDDAHSIAEIKSLLWRTAYILVDDHVAAFVLNR